MIIDDWFRNGRQLLPPEDPESPGQWKCKRCDGEGYIECSCVHEEFVDDCTLCQGDWCVTCDACDGRGYHKTQREAVP